MIRSSGGWGWGSVIHWQKHRQTMKKLHLCGSFEGLNKTKNHNMHKSGLSTLKLCVDVVPAYILHHSYAANRQHLYADEVHSSTPCSASARSSGM